MRNQHQKRSRTLQRQNHPRRHQQEQQHQTISAFGVLFGNQNKWNSRAPDLTGEFTFTPELIQNLQRILDADQESVTVTLCAWIKSASESDKEYLTVKMSAPNVLPKRHHQKQLHHEDSLDEARTLLDQFL
jgi:hypothetical protein